MAKLKREKRFTRGDVHLFRAMKLRCLRILNDASDKFYSIADKKFLERNNENKRVGYRVKLK